MSDQRPLARVPLALVVVLSGALALQIALAAARPRPAASADALPAPPSVAALRTASLGETVAAAQLVTLYLQAFDNQPGISIPFLSLDYTAVIAWLETILALDPSGQYPLLMASHLYAQVPDAAKQRTACDFVHRAFSRDPERRWRWLAHCAILAKHRTGDSKLALHYAEAITREARQASSWARQMRIFILEDLGEKQAAAVLLGGLLESGEVTDSKEIHFLSERLKTMKNDEISSHATKN